jgi:hypothetical protein
MLLKQKNSSLFFNRLILKTVFLTSQFPPTFHLHRHTKSLSQRMTDKALTTTRLRQTAWANALGLLQVKKRKRPNFLILCGEYGLH